jgi:hypothetical protein
VNDGKYLIIYKEALLKKVIDIYVPNAVSFEIHALFLSDSSRFGT